MKFDEFLRTEDTSGSARYVTTISWYEVELGFEKPDLTVYSCSFLV
jgi:hypothetical protein